MAKEDAHTQGMTGPQQMMASMLKMVLGEDGSKQVAQVMTGVGNTMNVVHAIKVDQENISDRIGRVETKLDEILAQLKGTKQ